MKENRYNHEISGWLKTTSAKLTDRKQNKKQFNNTVKQCFELQQIFDVQKIKIEQQSRFVPQQNAANSYKNRKSIFKNSENEVIKVRHNKTIPDFRQNQIPWMSTTAGKSVIRFQCPENNPITAKKISKYELATISFEQF